MSTREIFSKNLRTLRCKMGWSQLVMSRILDVSYAQYRRYESGESEPSINKLKDLFRLFHVNADSILNEVLPS